VVIACSHQLQPYVLQQVEPVTQILVSSTAYPYGSLFHTLAVVKVAYTSA